MIQTWYGHKQLDRSVVAIEQQWHYLLLGPTIITIFILVQHLILVQYLSLILSLLLMSLELKNLNYYLLIIINFIE